jgi:hypothetical protein
MWQPPLVGSSKAAKVEPGPQLVGSPIAIVAIGACIGFLPTLPALCLAYLSTGGGHGSYGWAWVFFPVPMILAAVMGNIGIIPMAAALVQFPIDGGILGYLATASQRHALIAALAIASAHVLPLVLFFILACLLN